MDQILQTLQALQDRVKKLEGSAIKLLMDPETYKQLNDLITTISTTVSTSVANSAVTTAIAALPTTTYSASPPSGTANTNSLWFEDGGTLATRKIYIYRSGWIQFK